MRHVNKSLLLGLFVIFSTAAIGCSKDDDAAGDAGGGSSAGTSGGGANDGGSSQTDAGGGSAGTGSATQDGGTSGAGGSGGSGGSGTIDAPPAIAELAEKIAGGICAALLDCVGPTKLTNMVGGEDCTERVKVEFLNGEFAYLQGSIDADRVVVTPTSVDACVAGIEALGCDIETHSFPAACETALEGKVKLGDVCTIDTDCAGTAFCNTDSCPSVCTALRGAGGSCNSDDECGDDLVCIGTCQAPQKDGGACAGTTGKVCALGWNCWNGDSTTAGVCHTNAETLVVAEGKTCEPGSTLCKEGLSCVWDGAAAFHCEAKVGAGEACRRGLPGQCPSDHYCATSNPKDVTQQGTCELLPGNGKECAYPGVCAPGLVCVPDGTTAVCRPIHDNGGACKIDAACRSGYCSSTICEAPAVCD